MLAQPASGDIGQQGTCIDDVVGGLAGSLAVAVGIGSSSTVVGAPAGAGIAGAGLGVVGSTLQSNYQDPCWDNVDSSELTDATENQRSTAAYERGVSAAGNLNLVLEQGQGGYDSVDEVQPVVSMLYAKIAFNDAYLNDSATETEAIQAAHDNADAYYASQERALADIWTKTLADISAAQSAEGSTKVIKIGVVKDNGGIDWSWSQTDGPPWSAENLSVANNNTVSVTLSDGSTIDVPALYPTASSGGLTDYPDAYPITPFTHDIVVVAEDPDSSEETIIMGRSQIDLVQEQIDSYDYTGEVDILVDPSQTESNVTTLSAALNQAQSGDVIRLSDGTYAQDESLNNNGNLLLNKSVTIVGSPDAVISVPMAFTVDGIEMHGITLNASSADKKSLNTKDTTGWTISHVKFVDGEGDDFQIGSGSVGTFTSNLVEGTVVDYQTQPHSGNAFVSENPFSQGGWAITKYATGDLDRIYDETLQREQNNDERIGEAGTGEKMSNIYRSLEQGVIDPANIFTATELQMLYGDETDLGSEPFVRSMMTQAGLTQTNASHAYVVKFHEDGKLGGATLTSNKTMEADISFAGQSVSQWESGQTYNTDNLDSSLYVYYTKTETNIQDGNITYEEKPWTSVYDGEFTVVKITDTDTGEEINSSETDQYGGDGSAAYESPELYGEEMAKLQSTLGTLQNEIDCLNQGQDYDSETGQCVGTTGGGGDGLGGLLPDFAQISIIGGVLVLLIGGWVFRPYIMALAGRN